MKKVIYTLLTTSALAFSSCQSNHVEGVSTGVKVIGQCCNSLMSATSNSANAGCTTSTETVTLNEKATSTVPLPSYLWDTKMIIW